MTRRRTLLAIVGLAVLALVLSACYPPRPALPAGKPAPQPAPDVPRFFDACTAPSQATMDKWWTDSPYEGVGIYIGGNSRACAQPTLTSDWVTKTAAEGWQLVPIWVGPQAPCTTFSKKISADPAQTYLQGVAEGNAAAAATKALGMPAGPVYYDMEGYPQGGFPKSAACSASVQNFITGWIDGLWGNGVHAGMYSSLCSGILDAAATPGSARLDSIWLAAWAYNDQNDPGYATYVPKLFGFTGCGASLPDSYWANHQRMRQYRGAHHEQWGGIDLDVDTNVDGGMSYPPGTRATS